MSIPSVNIVKTVGGIGGNADGKDHISALMGNVAAAPSGLALNTSVKLLKLSDAEALGITPAYDDTNSELLWWNIMEHFAMHSETALWILLYPAATTPATALADATNTHAKKLVVDAGGDIRQLGIYINPAGYSAGDTDGMKAEARAAIAAAQTFAAWAYSTHRPLHVVVEGCNLAATYGSVADLRDAGGIYKNVSVMIGMDYTKAASKTAYNKRAAVGTLLGLISSKRVHQSVGYVAESNIQDVSGGRWLVAGLSNFKKASGEEVSWETLSNQGFIFGITYTGLDGVYLNGDHTCCALTEDEHMIYFSRTKDKASRVLRTAYLPYLNKTEDVDGDTGHLPVEVINYYQAIGEKALQDNMASELSDFDVTVDPKSDLLGTKTLVVNFKIVPKGIVNKINGTLELTNSLN